MINMKSCEDEKLWVKLEWFYVRCVGGGTCITDRQGGASLAGLGHDCRSWVGEAAAWLQGNDSFLLTWGEAWGF